MSQGIQVFDLGQGIVKSRWLRLTAASTISPATVSCMPLGSRSNRG
jgi:hypothetical protein